MCPMVSHPRSSPGSRFEGHVLESAESGTWVAASVKKKSYWITSTIWHTYVQKCSHEHTQSPPQNSIWVLPCC